MKIRIRPDDPGMLKEPDWHQMNDWLAELRDDDSAEASAEPYSAGGAEPYTTGHAEPAGASAEPNAASHAEPYRASAEPNANGHAEPAGASAEPTAVSHAEPYSMGRAEPTANGHAERVRSSDPRPEAPAAWLASRPVAPTGRRPRVGDSDPLEITVRPLIGDQLRMPIMWCEMGSCISWHTDPAALGEADTRARAIGAGWRVDALGRLACPQCQQTDAGFRARYPVALWNREEAITMAARIGAARGDYTASPGLFPPSPRD